MINGQGIDCSLTVVHGTLTRAQSLAGRLIKVFFLFKDNSIIRKIVIVKTLYENSVMLNGQQ
jgi:hypothetical protein